MITETAEQIAHRYLVDIFQDEDMINDWRRNAKREWNLTLQLCVSFMDEIGALRGEVNALEARGEERRSNIRQPR